MFHTAQWSSEHSSATPPLSSIKIWAHLTGVPLDLRYQQGLSLVTGLIGEPKETDDFTLNLVSLTLSHVKVEVDLTEPLPRVVEFQRQSGEVVEVQVDYPWLPSTCSHCKELGHVMKNCLKIPLQKSSPTPPVPGSKTKKTVEGIVPQEKAKGKVNETTPQRKTGNSVVKSKHYVIKKPTSIPAPCPKLIPPASNSHSVSLPSSPLAQKTPCKALLSTPNANQLTTYSLSEKIEKPSLKRSRSSPTLSPPSHPKISFQSSNPSHSSLFPEIGTLQYISDSSFIGPILKNSFLPLLNVDSLQISGEPPPPPPLTS
ncbi:hypothetical protein YC2023_015819 [Brassica napus]